jgi:large subunit ribosomal protein L25
MELVIQAAPRNEIGTSASRKMRRELGQLPGVIYGNKMQPMHISVDHKQILHLYKTNAFYSKVFNVEIDGKKQSCILKAIDCHPFKEQVLHIDLLTVSNTSKLSINVPVHYLNQDNCIGIKQQGGQLSIIRNEIAINCTAKDLPEYIEVDLEELKLGDSLDASLVQLPSGVSLNTKANKGGKYILAKIEVSRTSAIGDESESAAEGTTEETDSSTEE